MHNEPSCPPLQTHACSRLHVMQHTPTELLSDVFAVVLAAVGEVRDEARHPSPLLSVILRPAEA